MNIIYYLPFCEVIASDATLCASCSRQSDHPHDIFLLSSSMVSTSELWLRLAVDQKIQEITRI